MAFLSPDFNITLPSTLLRSMQIRALQHFYCRSSDSAFSVKQHILSRAEINAHFGRFLPVRNHGDVYHAFVSYR
jgi:hypothetical protein